MDIIFHGHHASVSERMRQRAAAGVRKLTTRMERAVDAIIRFEEDGPVRRVEIILHAPRQKRLIAEAEGRYYGPALIATLARLKTQIASVKRDGKARARATAKAARSPRRAVEA